MGLVLGTVQLGLPYGISNTSGMPSAVEANEILTQAMAAGIAYFDTAAAYGKSEELLGGSKVLGRQIITKISSLDGAANDVYHKLNASLASLRRESIYAMLFHRVEDLDGEGSSVLMEQAVEAKKSGLIEKIGVSIYSPDQARRILDRYEIDMIQLPFNVFDQRAEQSGLLRELNQSNIEVHARSVFLQGLLLMSPSALPTYFNGLRAKLLKLRGQLEGLGQTPLSGALQFVRANPYIDHFVVGVNSTAELAEVMAAYESPLSAAMDWADYAITDEMYLNPSQWEL
jgi:aryl-alcohol dehydrogenase-like predicted oxidoreductase